MSEKTITLFLQIKRYLVGTLFVCKLDPFQKAMFLFRGQRRDRMKMLLWEGDGFLLLYKRWEGGRFQWPRTVNEVQRLSAQHDGGNWREIRRSLQMKPAQFWIREDVYYTYACKKCEEETGEANIRKTPKQAVILPGNFAFAEAAAHIMTQKFVMYPPLYRLEQEFHRRG